MKQEKIVTLSWNFNNIHAEKDITKPCDYMKLVNKQKQIYNITHLSINEHILERRKNNMNKREMEIHFSTWFDIIPLFPDAKML